MKETNVYDVVVIGGGPAGLAAAEAAAGEHASVLVIEREERLGGILKQCIHDGFGLIRFGEKLSGPEYAERYIERVKALPIDCLTSAFVTAIERIKERFSVTVVSREGLQTYLGRALILATGCRERTAKQVFIHGTRPAGILTAGAAQHLTNLMGEKVTRRCVILGSGDIGLIMARRLTLEGAKVVGVYEVQPRPSGLTRNIVQCLNDYDIPLYLSHTVTRVLGNERVEGVEISRVDERFAPIPGTEQVVACDALILSVGLIPENEIAERLSIALDGRTKGPLCDTAFMTTLPGVFSCGNAMHVNDLVDYVSEGGAVAGRAAARYRAGDKPSLPVKLSGKLLYMTPQRIALYDTGEKAVFYFRSSEEIDRAALRLRKNGETVFEKTFRHLRPPEMQRVEIGVQGIGFHPGDVAECSLEVIE